MSAVSFLVRRATDRQSKVLDDQEYAVERLVVSAEDRGDITLPGLRPVLQFSADGKGGLRFRARGESVTRAGEATSAGRLAPGEAIETGGFRFAAIAAPAGFTAALEITGGADTAGVWLEQLDFERRAPSLRVLGYLALLLVLVFGALIPGLVLVDDDLRTTVRSAPLTDDSFWSSGPISRAHTTAGVALECEACHVQPFVSAGDDSCLACHTDMAEHVAMASTHVELFAGDSCAGCHREHNEPELIARSDKGLCVDCHAVPGDWEYTGEGGMQAVAGFTAAEHPTFRLALWRPQGAEAALGWTRERLRPEAGAAIAETSMLKFNHEVHMDPDKVQLEDSGAAMGCGDCHTLKDSGEHFEPIAMDTHCRSCHGLSFDVFDPDIELPHGEVRAVITAMEAHFIREFTDPVLRAERALEKPRRVPGKRTAATVCEGNGLDCGRTEAAKEAEYQFMDTGCVTCHEVTDSGSASLMDRWRVHPAKVALDWYPESRFLHSAHRYGEVEPDAACLSCHEATVSASASDILVPNQDNCLACHDESRDGVAAECTACHGFHRDGGAGSLQVRAPHQQPGTTRGEVGG